MLTNILCTVVISLITNTTDNVPMVDAPPDAHDIYWFNRPRIKDPNCRDKIVMESVSEVRYCPELGIGTTNEIRRTTKHLVAKLVWEEAPLYFATNLLTYATSSCPIILYTNEPMRIVPAATNYQRCPELIRTNNLVIYGGPLTICPP